MAAESPQYPGPPENFSSGLYQVDIPNLGERFQGKVRDRWVVPGKEDVTVLVTTDRTSAYDRVIATIPGRGRVLNEISADWFTRTSDIVPNHAIEVPHPNVLIARNSQNTMPVEVVVREYMARSGTSTSVFRQYDEGNRNIYGIDFPDGLQANQRLPMGPIITPTTKAEQGDHDSPLTNDQARSIVDDRFRPGTWDRTQEIALALFRRGQSYANNKGLIIADTKFEFAVESDQVVLIDEVFTPDSSRFWKADSYGARTYKGQDPENFDKEKLRKHLDKDLGYTGEGPVPVVDSAVIDEMAEAYLTPYERLIGANRLFPDYPFNIQPEDAARDINDAISRSLR